MELFLFIIFLFSTISIHATQTIYTFTEEDLNWDKRLNHIISLHYQENNTQDTLVILFFPGNYYIKTPIIFKNNQSKSTSSPIIIQGMGDVAFRGGILLDNNRFKPLDNKLQSRIYSADAIPHIVEYSLNKNIAVR